MQNINMLMRFLCGGIAVCSLVLPSAAVAQSTVPIRELGAPTARTAVPFGNIFGVRELTGQRVLVNDGINRQLFILSATFAERTVSLDSATVGGQSYGPRASPLIPYLADSSLFVDGASLTLLVIGPSGAIARVMSAPKPGDLSALAASAAGVDAKGNLVYRGRVATDLHNAGANGRSVASSDSSPIVRADFDTRQVDTLGRVKVQSGSRTSMSQDATGKMVAKAVINPLNTVDEWAVLSDGTVAFVRGQDYHVDLLQANGKRTSAAKLPFDWKRLTDDDKQALIDSARTAMEKAVAQAKANAANPGAAQRAIAEVVMASTMATGGGTTGGSGAAFGGHGAGGAGFSSGGGEHREGAGRNFTAPTMLTEFVPIKEMADYYPAIRAGAAKADLDGNLWILPTSSAQSKAGELVYDVVNNRGGLIWRVRLPVGRAIAGFGHDGVVYLMQREAGSAGWQLERTRLLQFTPTPH